MKLHHSLLAAALLAGVSTSAAAQSTGIVTLGGTIMPTSCALTLDNGGTADLGQIDAATLGQSSMTMQPAVTLGLEIDCTGPTLFALTLNDNKDGTSEGNFPNQLGLGLTSTGKRFGRVGFATNTATADSTPTTVISSTNLTTWVDAGAGFWNKKQSGSNFYRAFGTAAAGPAPLTEATVNIRIDANINSRNNLQLTQDETIDGSATLEVFYF